MNAEIIQRVQEAYEQLDAQRRQRDVSEWTEEEMEEFRASQNPESPQNPHVDPWGFSALRDEIRQLRAALIQTVELPDGSIEATFSMKKLGGSKIDDDDHTKK